MDRDLLNKLRAAEESHLRPDIRADLDQLNDILDDAYLEIGASGNRFTKQDVLNALPDESPCTRTIDQFEATQLAPDLFLTTYRIKKQSSEDQPPTSSRRSTLWLHDRGTLRMRFHQGTPINT